MSVIASAAASTASPIVDLFNHTHKKTGHAASSTDAGAASATQGRDTNHGLFSSLLESLEQVIGVSLTAPASAAPVTAAATSAAAASGTTASAVSHPSNALGANVNAKV
jgi:hypothetical protein